MATCLKSGTCNHLVIKFHATSKCSRTFLKFTLSLWRLSTATGLLWILSWLLVITLCIWHTSCRDIVGLGEEGGDWGNKLHYTRSCIHSVCTKGLHSLNRAEVDHARGSYNYGDFVHVNFNMEDKTTGQLEPVLYVSTRPVQRLFWTKNFCPSRCSLKRVPC